MIDINNLPQITQIQVDEQSHIILDKEICQSCEHHSCVNACPANCYSYSVQSKRMDVVYETCLECGTCYVICDKKAVNWSYPRGGFGVNYRLT